MSFDVVIKRNVYNAPKLTKYKKKFGIMEIYDIIIIFLH